METSASHVQPGPVAPVPLPVPGGRSVRTAPLKLPAIVLLLLWSIVPLAMTLWFSFQHYNLLIPGSVLVVTVSLGTLLAVLFDQDFFGRGVARVLMIAPFFVMPTVSALVWKNMLMHPANGVISFLLTSVGLEPIDWFSQAPLASIIIIVAWQWLPFAALILLTAIQALDPERKEAARMDGAGPFSMFFFIIIPHLARAISVVVMIETLFLLAVFAEIFVTTAGGPGLASTNLAFLIYRYALLEYDVGAASAGGVLAIVLANVVAAFLVRAIAKNIEA